MIASRPPEVASKRVDFLFLGETLLLPHLFPIVEALAKRAPDVRPDLWVSTSVHEDLLRTWLAGGPAAHARIRRAPGFRALKGLAAGDNPPLPNKLLMLARLAPRLALSRVVVVAEQTSLWLPRLLPLRARFVKTSHGVGSMSARDDPRRRAAAMMLVPSQLEKQTYLDRGFPDAKIGVTGYVKSEFRQRSQTSALFADARPIILYTPHWQRHRSSWWNWGREVVARLAAQDRFNVILAPHQRLIEKAPEVKDVLAAAARLPHVHADWSSFAMVDGSYTAAADIYLGDTSSQIVEYLARPRPAIFLNDSAIDWQASESHGFWSCGEVIDSLDALLPAIDGARAAHPRFAETQRLFAEASLGPLDGRAAWRAAGAVLDALQA